MHRMACSVANVQQVTACTNTSMTSSEDARYFNDQLEARLVWQWMASCKAACASSTCVASLPLGSRDMPPRLIIVAILFLTADSLLCHVCDQILRITVTTVVRNVDRCVAVWMDCFDRIISQLRDAQAPAVTRNVKAKHPVPLQHGAQKWCWHACNHQESRSGNSMTHCE